MNELNYYVHSLNREVYLDKIQVLHPRLKLVGQNKAMRAGKMETDRRERGRQNGPP